MLQALALMTILIILSQNEVTVSEMAKPFNQA